MLIFLRDWHPVLREPLDLSASASRSAIFALQGEHDAAMRLVFPGVAVFAVRAIDVPRAVDRVFCTAMFFQGWGNALHLFSAFWWYRQQRSHHLPMSLAPILYIGFARLGDVVPAPAGCAGSDSELCGMTLITCCLGVTARASTRSTTGRRPLVRTHLFIGETDTITASPTGSCGRALAGCPPRLGAHALHEPPSFPIASSGARQRRTANDCSTTSTTS